MIIAFDVDGTLLNTYPLVRASYIHSFNKLLPTFKYDEKLIQSFFGPPLPETFHHVVQDEKKIQALITEYQSFSNQNAKKYLTTYPHTHETLQALKDANHHLVVLSNKKSDAIIFEFTTVGIIQYFDEIIGYDKVQNPKPHPEGIQLIQDKYQDRCLLVGDSIYDIKTAKSANIKAVGVTWALTSKNELLQAGADYLIDDFLELLEIVKEENNV